MPDFSFEDQARAAGARVVCGVDEAGRGPLAGPVVAAAALLDAGSLDVELVRGLDDSKKLTERKRDHLFDLLDASPAVRLSVAVAEVVEIERFNILGATLNAMARAVAGLSPTPDLALVDGNRPPKLGSCRVECLVKGDGKSLSIAAASIAAKVTRDRIMLKLAEEFPGYGWETNMGYGAKAHLAALERLGLTPHHRKNFAPVRKMLSPETPGLLDFDSKR